MFKNESQKFNGILGIDNREKYEILINIYEFGCNFMNKEKIVLFIKKDSSDIDNSLKKVINFI